MGREQKEEKSMNISKRRFLFQNGGYYHIFYRDVRVSAYEHPHMHSFWQCLFVKKGRITQIQDGTKYYQVEGEVFLTPPGREHSLYVFANDTVYYCVSFSEALLEDALIPYPQIKKDFSNIKVNYCVSPQRLALLDASCAALMKMPESVMPYEKDCGYHIACAVISAALADAPLLSQGQPNDGNEQESTMNAVVRYFEQFYFENLNIEEIAEKFGFKRGTFCNRFIERTGISPKRYLTERRIHEAMCLIDTTDPPLNKVAEQVGYNDFSTFYRNFLRITQKTPSEYQAQLRCTQEKKARESEATK